MQFKPEQTSLGYISVHDIEGNHITCCSTSHFIFHQGWLCNSDLSGLKIFGNVTNPYSKLYSWRSVTNI